MGNLSKIYAENLQPKILEGMVDVLKNGGFVIYHTDTVYALGCYIKNIKAMQQLSRIKGEKLEWANLAFICHNLSNLSAYATQQQYI